MKVEKTLIYIRCLLVLLFLTLSQTSGQAQRFGAAIVAGMNASQIDGDQLAGYDKIGLSAGFKTMIQFESALKLNVEFLYSERGSRPNIFNDDYDPDINITLQYIEIPFYVSIGDWWQEEGQYHKVSAHGGFSYGRLIDASTVDYYNSAEDSYDKLVPYFNENDVSWFLGIDYRFSPRFGVMGRYTRGITPLLDPEKNNLNTPRLLTYFLTLRLDYYFK
jgi:hypothetical protein